MDTKLRKPQEFVMLLFFTAGTGMLATTVFVLGSHLVRDVAVALGLGAAVGFTLFGALLALDIIVNGYPTAADHSISEKE